MKPAILYAAKSTEDVRGSIPDQLADTRKLAGERGLDVVDEFKDEAASAFHGNRGEGLAKAMAACERLSAEHGECWLLVQHSSRLARGDAMQARHLVEITLWAMKHRVVIASVHDPGMFPDDPEDPVALLLSSVAGTQNHQESARKSKAVSKGMRRRAERGGWVGGHPPFGLQHRDRHAETGAPTGPLILVAPQAEVVRRVFRDYASGLSQRTIVRALNAEAVPTMTGRPWQQSAISRMLGSVAYVGKLLVKDDQGERTRVLDGQHEAIIDAELWARVQAIRAGGSRRKGTTQPDGSHLLTHGTLRCVCGSAMLPRKARPGVERERYVCRGRIEHGSGFCSQSSIRREAIDEPLLATLLDGFIDLDATRQRIEARASSALQAARQACEQADCDAATAEAKLARVRGDYQAGKIEADDWSEQRPQLTAELDAAKEAAQRAREHVQRVEQGSVPGDAEQALLDHLATLKRAVGEGVGAAPDLPALRNVIGDLLASIDLARNDDGSYLLLPLLRVNPLGDGRWDFDSAGRRQELPVGAETPSPTGQPTPVGCKPQYPPVPDADPFLARYCWWYDSA
jgi:DNA invertase Pin-like site-specific DNA recombinase